ncbi:hypothetical protein [Streptomyces yangpuensis]|uniref:hypothetical protein n=1 Tax=Streptomyces yangpuensis TaxID=1648182 RepID=UPI00382D645E
MLTELEALITELEHLTCEDRLLQLRARAIRAGVLIDEGRPAEAEAGVGAVLRVLTRTMYVTDVWDLELDALVRVGQALCALGRHEEAETIARGHLPRTDGYLLNDMHLLLLHSLPGQGRHEEALAEPYRHSSEPFPAYAARTSWQLPWPCTAWAATMRRRRRPGGR